jgi:Flp pilus assembly protein TadG
MRRYLSILRRLAVDTTASMAIETALVTPVLVVMSVGGFQASEMVARQSELQSAAAEAATIAMAATPDSYDKVQTIRSVIEASTGLDSSHVTVYRLKRCGTDTNYIYYFDDCDTGEAVATFLYIYITDTYTPEWVDFGIGSPLTYRVRRTVQIS